MAVNLDILRNYLNHDESMVRRFLHLFCSAVPDDLDKLKLYLLENDYEMASIAAHGIKTQCAYLGLEQARELALKIEEFSTPREQKVSMAEELENQLRSEIAEIKMTMNI